MKKFIKSIPVYLTVVMILCCSLAVPAFAATDGDVMFPLEQRVNQYYSAYGGSLSSCDGWFASNYVLSAGDYIFNFDFKSACLPESDLNAPSVYAVTMLDFATGENVEVKIVPGSVFSVTDDMLCPEVGGDYAFVSGKCVLWVNSFGFEPTVMEVSRPGVYYQAFDMFAGFIYGEDVELTAEQNMVLTILATTAVLFVVVVPFLIVFFVLRLFR